MGRFARYEFVQKIAIGGMAEVWSAWGVGADGAMTDVVVKRILPQFASDDSFQDMLLSEAEVTAHLQHPNIVAVLDWGHLDETCFLAMERVVGLDGRQLLDACAMRKTTIPPAVALFAMGEIYKGLDYAHRSRDERGQSLGIVHRDVSPSNVLLSVTGDVKLADFGIARAKSRASHTQAGQVRGKPRYMSPEQAKGEDLDGRSDLFAAGLVLHEFLTGQPVFPASTYLEEVVALIQKGVRPPSQVNPAVPPELDALVLRLCERDRAIRFRSGAAAFEAIADWAKKNGVRLDRGAAAELVTSIVRPTQQKKPAEARGETRIVRIDDVDGVARFTTQGKIVDPDLLAETNPSGRAPPHPTRRSAGITGVLAAVATAIAVAIWWVASPRDPVQTGELPDDSPVPTLALVEDPSLAATPAPEETPEEIPEKAPVVVATRRPPKASPTPSATATAAPVIAEGRGFLTLRAKPNGEVTIDGQWAGSTPLAKHELASGVHTVTVNADDGRQATEEVTVLPDQTTSVTLTLK